ncbi:hypothetical protein HK104_003575 [Borealophlyctis nickersoniae]|nr:hypothetical protein HK104_003575 [Borealophlyctis nickersoniae]
MAKKKAQQKKPAPARSAAPPESDSELEISFSAPAPTEDAPDETQLNVDEEGNDLGGLMSALNARKKKDTKKKKKRGEDDEEDAAAILARLDAEGADEVEEPATPAPKKGKAKKGKKGKAADFDDEMDHITAEIEGGAEPAEEVAPVEPKGKKGKKGKKNKGGDFDDEFDQPSPEPEPVSAPPAKTKGKAATPQPEEDEEETGGEIRLKSKKEKEKERKERQKAAKKQQQQKQGGAAKVDADEPSSPATPVSEPTVPAVEEGAAGETDKKKKKKKGAKKAEEEAPPAAAPSKKKAAGLKLLQEALAAQRAAEEEAKRKEEEERLRIEEEIRRQEEEERRKEEAKRLKKEREKQRVAELKKAGQYLTPAQKAAQAQQRAKLDAMIAAGLKVEALEAAPGEEKKPKKVVYGKKKKQTKAEADKEKESKRAEEEEARKAQEAAEAEAKAKEAAAAKQRAEDEEAAREQEKALAQAEAERVLQVMQTAAKESWEEESDGDTGVKDSWDMETDQEEEAKDNWDDETDEEKEKQKQEDKAKAKAAVTANGNGLAKGKATKKEDTRVSAKPAAKPPAKGSAKSAGGPAKKAPPPKKEESEEESSEEESDSEEDSDEDSDENSDEELTTAQKLALKKKEEAAARKKERVEQALAARSKDNLRSPICCILGHVDTGKTKILDKIRQTNVQEGEAGGITQQIGATYFPIQAIKEKTALLYPNEPADYKIPGLLVIDTPGHESFTNLRSRGSSLCNIAILVVDIVHGLEPQTLESLGLLRQRKTPFIVALNKIDRMFDWKPNPNSPTRDTLAKQAPHAQKEFQDRVKKVIVEFAEQGLNACLYWDNKNYAKNVSLVPTSAHTGEGIPDLLNLLVDLTQTRMTERLMYLSELECTVLEVKVVEGHGTTIDVVLSNGVLNEGDRIVVCGLNGPIVTNIRALLTPQPMRELRVKSAYVHHKTVKASLGVKISAPGMENAIAGSRLMVVGPDDDEDELKDEVMEDLTSLLSSIDKAGKGVCVQASTLGSLEALLTFLKSSNIPVSGINIGPVHKRDIIRASIMLERAREYAQLLAFDVPIDKEAAEMAEELGVKIFTADIIYHLFDSFTAYMKDIEEQKRRDAAPMAVFPCLLRIVPGAIFNKRNPIILGIDVLEGSLKIGTPLCVVNEENKQVIPLGKVTSIELNHKAKQEVKKGEPSVAVRIEGSPYEAPKLFGRHFTEANEIYSHISRASIEILKSTFRNDLSKEDWALVIKLKKVLQIA